MSKFEVLFGMKAKEIKPNCLLMPLLPNSILVHLGVKKLKRGILYASGNAEGFSLINTGMSAGLSGDAVLYLKDTPCRNVILYGSCGLVKEKYGLSIGSLVVPYRCFEIESFSKLLIGSGVDGKVYYPHAQLYDRPSLCVRDKITSATIASLKLEEDLRHLFIKKGIDVVEMECSAVFSAASVSGLRAAALFYISDVIQDKPFYLQLEPGQKSNLSFGIKHSADLLCRIIKEKLSA